MRTVIEEEDVSYVVDREQEIYPRLVDAFDALKWWLAREPETGVLLDDINWIFRQDGDAALKIPTLVVIYTFDHFCVTLKYILVRIPPS